MLKTTYNPLAICTLLGLIAYWGCQGESESIQPEFRPLSESVYASVIVQPMLLYDVFSMHPGMIDRFFVEEGDHISKGQVVAEIRSIGPQFNLDNENLRYQLAEDQYKGEITALITLREEIALIEIQVRMDSQNFARQTRLWEQNIGSKASLENYELNYQASRKSLDALRTGYEQKERDLKSRYDQAQVAMRQAEVTLDEFKVQSRLDGCIYEVLKEEGERVMLQEPIARIGLCDSFIIQMQVDEVDIAQLHVDQLVIIGLDAYPGEVFEAAVTRILPSKNQQTQTFTVEARFNESPGVLYAGFAGEANIVIATREKALTIPLEYVKDGNLVITADGERTIKTGLKSLEFIEVVSGIDTSTKILKPKYK